VSAKAKAPVLFETRWAMSYLRGPLTKDQVATLMKDVALPAAPAPAAPVETEAVVDGESTPVAPPVASGVPVVYLDPGAPWAAEVAATPGGQRLRAFLAARVGVRFDDTAAKVDERQEYEALYPLDGGLELDSSHVVDYDDRDFGSAAPAGATYVLPSAPIGEASFFRDAGRDITRRLADTQVLEIERNAKLKLVSRPGESAEEFAARCDQAAQAAADAEAAKIKQKLETQQDKLERALELAQRRLEEVTTDQRSRQASELVAGAGAILGAFLGGRRSTRSIAGSIGSAASRRGMSARAGERKQTAETKVARAQDDLVEIEQRILDEVQAIDEKWKSAAVEIETLSIRPEATDVRVEQLALVWVPTG
jgi:hypothetical protein